MPYRRTGNCNMCGECCGYPRPDGHQTSPWSNNWPNSLNTWQIEDIKKLLPLFRLIPHPKEGGKKRGTVTVGDKIFNYSWIKNHGLVINNKNLSCPFLSKKLEDGTVPCLLYGTECHFIWEQDCQFFPPPYLNSLKAVEDIFEAYPNCSYIYVKED